MKKGLLFAIVLLLTSPLWASSIKIFDLHDQYFSGTMIKKGEEGYGKEAQYDLKYVRVVTDTIYNGSSYRSGLFTVELKEPIVDWTVHIKTKNGTLNGGERTTIRITSNNGESYFISYEALDGGTIRGNPFEITINNKTFKVFNMQNKRLTATIKKRGDIVTFYINGKPFLKQNRIGFTKLSKVEVEVNNHYHYYDELLSLDIYKVK